MGVYGKRLSVFFRCSALRVVLHEYTAVAMFRMNQTLQLVSIAFIASQDMTPTHLACRRNRTRRANPPGAPDLNVAS